MKYFLKLPEHYVDCGPHEIRRIFNEYRAWLEENIGAEKELWEYMTGDLHAIGVFLPTKGDLIMFKLKFKV